MEAAGEAEGADWEGGAATGWGAEATAVAAEAETAGWVADWGDLKAGAEAVEEEGVAERWEASRWSAQGNRLVRSRCQEHRWTRCFRRHRPRSDRCW